MASIKTLLQRGRRLFAHRCTDVRDIHAAFSPAAVTRLAERVTASEQHHSGELRICIEAGLPWSYIARDATPRDRALTLFGKLRVWDTQHNNGVLIYLLLAEHAIELVADRGLNEWVRPEQWLTMTATLGQFLSNHQFEEGLNYAIDALSAVLMTHYPQSGPMPATNELPDKPVLLL